MYTFFQKEQMATWVQGGKQRMGKNFDPWAVNVTF